MNHTPIPPPLILTAGKRDLVIDPPWTNAAGILGFSDETSRWLDPRRLGAFVTHPASLARRSPARGTRVIEFPGGVLLHTGLANPGLAAVLRRHRRRWARLERPVILHLLAQDPDDLRRCVEILDAADTVAAVELGLGELDPGPVAHMVQALFPLQRPILAHWPMGAHPDSPRAAVDAGASALVIGPPRGALPDDKRNPVQGRLYGPALRPLVLQAVDRLAPRLGRPVIAGVGIEGVAAARAAFSAGAAALQWDVTLWSDPAVLQRFGEAGAADRDSRGAGDPIPGSPPSPVDFPKLFR